MSEKERVGRKEWSSVWVGHERKHTKHPTQLLAPETRRILSQNTFVFPPAFVPSVRLNLLGQPVFSSGWLFSASLPTFTLCFPHALLTLHLTGCMYRSAPSGSQHAGVNAGTETQAHGSVGNPVKRARTSNKCLRAWDQLPRCGRKRQLRDKFWRIFTESSGGGTAVYER